MSSSSSKNPQRPNAGELGGRSGHRTVGESRVWLCGMGLALGIAMVFGLLGLIAVNGLSVFWPHRIAVVELIEESNSRIGDARVIAGQIVKEQTSRDQGGRTEWQLFVGNRDAYGFSFKFIDADDVAAVTHPGDLIVAERMEYGDAIFTPVELRLSDGGTVAAADDRFDAELSRLVNQAGTRRHEIRRLERHEIGAVNRSMRSHQFEIRKLELDAGPDDEKRARKNAALNEKIAGLQKEYEGLAAAAGALRAEQSADQLVFKLATGEERTQALGEFVTYYRPNDLSTGKRIALSIVHFWRFLSEDPREANTEGGIFPAIFGTFIMTLIMSIIVTPFGVIAAIYLREYAYQGLLVRTVRISVNNLAGVPSIVFGVFGLGFFVYGIGSYIDGGPKNPIPPASWWLLSVASIVVIVLAILLSIRNTPGPGKPATPVILHRLNAALWTAGALLLVISIARTPYFNGFFEAALPSPTYGTGGIFWASLTLALLTLPVVIVATEEALASVPRGVREAALACGSSKWQMIQRVVLPSATPGVLTGVILAMARGAGEVAPLMLVGVVKLAPSLPVDTIAPFIHPERKFMHLGFHIYDLGFQSPDSEAAKPMVFATTFLLIALVIVMNLAAIQIRNRLRKKYAVGTF